MTAAVCEAKKITHQTEEDDGEVREGEWGKQGPRRAGVTESWKNN